MTEDLLRAAARGDRTVAPSSWGAFGSHQNADRAARLRWTEWVRRQAERLGIGWCYWALATEFGVFRSDVGAWDEGLLAALLPERGVRQLRT